MNLYLLLADGSIVFDNAFGKHISQMSDSTEIFLPRSALRLLSSQQVTISLSPHFSWGHLLRWSPVFHLCVLQLCYSPLNCSLFENSLVFNNNSELEHLLLLLKFF